MSAVYRKENGSFVKKTAYQRINGEWVLISTGDGKFLYGHVAKDGETPTHIINGVVYVGVVTPDIDSVYTPELKATHPYAYITTYKVASLTYHELHLCASMYTKIHTDYTNEWALFAVDVLTANIMPRETEWRTPEVDYKGTVKVCDYGSDYVMWSNHSFYGENGEEWINASDPIPVYE